MKLSTIQDADGNEIPSMTGSYLAWRGWCGSHHIPMKTTLENGVCKYCGGWKEIVTTQYGRMWCLCVIEKRTNELEIQHSEYRSITNKDATLDNFQIWGRGSSQDSLIQMTDYIGDWVLWPEKWITIMGDPGSGKSHMLSAISKLLPWSLYITSSDFESKAFKLTKTIGDTTLEDMLDVVSQAPILLYDDYGQEYGKDYIKALFRRVIDFRYRRPTEYVTVVTTNMNNADMYRTDERVADRLLDVNIGKLIVLMNVGSWRRKDGNNQFTDLD